MLVLCLDADKDGVERVEAHGSWMGGDQGLYAGVAKEW